MGSRKTVLPRLRTALAWCCTPWIFWRMVLVAWGGCKDIRGGHADGGGSGGEQHTFGCQSFSPSAGLTRQRTISTAWPGSAWYCWGSSSSW